MGTQKFVSVIVNVATWLLAVLPAIKQFVDQVRIRLISQFISIIASVLQKLFRYFNGAIISTSFESLLSVWPAIFSLNLNKALLPGN